jgi:hypothetical protein
MAKNRGIKTNPMSMTFGGNAVNVVYNKPTVYVTRGGSIVGASEWTRLRGNKDYIYPRRYENEKLSVVVEWIGKFTGANLAPREHWKLYAVRVGNVIITGDRPGTFIKKVVTDPQLTMMFGTEKDAMAYYQKILSDRGLLQVTETYEGDEVIVEVGNMIEQPPLTESFVQVPKEQKAASKAASNFGDW